MSIFVEKIIRYGIWNFIFKCDECGNKFKAPAAEWCATCYIAPAPCTKCGSMHTYPIGLGNLGGILGPKPVYHKIWESMDKNES